MLKANLPHLPTDHPKVEFGRIGVLLINLGTPDGTDYWSMRRYLKEFLSDRRVIEVNPVVWWVILNAFVLTKRPFSSGEAYKLIWNKEKDESPLRTITRSQAEKIGETLSDAPQVIVDWAMRYGNPSIRSRLLQLQKQGCERILLFPLYPQYSAATTGTACDKAFDALKEMRWQPTIRVVPPYYDEPAYIDALARSVREGIANLDFEPEVVVASFHGLPLEYFQKGDPYHCHCAKTARLLREALGWDQHKLRLTFPVPLRQCRVAPALYRQDHRGIGAGRSQAARGGHARLLCRLRRDAGRDRHARARNLRGGRGRTVCAAALPQRHRRQYRHAQRDHKARTRRVARPPAAEVSAATPKIAAAGGRVSASIAPESASLGVFAFLWAAVSPTTKCTVGLETRENGCIRDLRHHRRHCAGDHGRLSAVIVPQGQHYTVERLGRYVRTLQPGLRIVVPFVEKIGRRVVMMEQVIDIPTQDVITRDNVVVEVDAIAFMQVMDAAQSAYASRICARRSSIWCSPTSALSWGRWT